MIELRVEGLRKKDKKELREFKFSDFLITWGKKVNFLFIEPEELMKLAIFLNGLVHECRFPIPLFLDYGVDVLYINPWIDPNMVALYRRLNKDDLFPVEVKFMTWEEYDEYIRDKNQMEEES